VVHAVKLASIAAYALLKLAVSGQGPLGGADQLSFAVAKDASSGKSLAIILRRTEQNIGHIAIRAAAPAQPDLEVYGGRTWVPRGSQSAGGATVDSACQGAVLGAGASSRHWPAQSPVALASVGGGSRGGGRPSGQRGRPTRLLAEQYLPSHPLSVEQPKHRADSRSGRRDEGCAHAGSTRAHVGAKSVPARPALWSINIDAVEAFRQRNLLVSRAPAELAAALDAIEGAYFADEATLTAVAEPRDLRSERQLQRRIPTTGFSAGADLGHSDGIRCGTLAEAYPRIIDMLRSMSGTAQSDHMSRNFRELTGFKLVLETATSEPVVPYYWSQEVSSLDEYVDKQFVQADGLFAQALKGTGPGGRGQGPVPGGGKCGRICDPGGSRQPPHCHDRRTSARGLAQAAWARLRPHSARATKGRWKLHFQWVWRTVEALVGLPFSAYGSIRQSESILRQVNAALGQRPVPVEMGEVTYFALSLHLFLDEGDKDIARTIVLDAYE